MGNIKKNLYVIYFQQLINIVVGIFSSRYLLEFLGVENYGLYGLVGSLIATLAALKIIFVSSVQRFINIENGRSSSDRVKLIFTYGVALHLGLAITFIIVAECIGLIGIPKLNLPQNQLSVAYWLLQFSIISSFFDIIAIPYDALIIANERIYIYSFINIFSQSLKFGGIFLLTVLPYNRVLTYAFIVIIISVLSRFASSLYCKRHFHEVAQFDWKWDKTLFKEMCFFSGWNFFGNLSYSLVNEGLNIVLNIFGGITVNAARALAFQFRGVLSSAISQMFVVFRPRIMSSYGNNDIKMFLRLTILSGKIALFISIVVGSIFILFGHEILRLWLTVIPQYTYSFICLIVIYICIRAIHDPLDTAFKSYGRIKAYQLVECFNSILTLPISYIFLYYNYPYYFVFVSLLITEVINLGVILILAHVQFAFPSWVYAKHLLIPGVLSLIGVAVLYLLYKLYMPTCDNVIQQLFWMVLSFICISALIIPLLFSRKELCLILRRQSQIKSSN